MTVRELSQLKWLKGEVADERRRLHALLAKKDAQSDPYNRKEIARLQGLVKDNMARCIKEQEKLETFIADISDSYTRRIFSLRFLDGLTWSKVAEHLGGSNTEDSVRKIVCRYLKSLRVV